MPHRFSILITAILLLLPYYSFSQAAWLYTPLKDDTDKLKALQAEIRKQYEKDSTGITGENKKYILEIYKDRFKGLNELFETKEPLVDAEASSYLGGITGEIINKNPELKKLTPRIFFSRAWWPNAYSTGEGTIVFNIDLFTKLQNESQVAFVLCHELAHLYLDHSNKKINKYISTIYSAEYQQQLKALKKQEYNKKEELDKLEMGFAFKSFRHSRESETEADTVGLRFLRNTGYDCKEAIACLAILDEIDEEKMDYAKQLASVFSFTGYPFKKRWIEKEAAFFGVTAENNDNKKLEDSLKTHPDCKARMQALEPILQNHSPTNGQQHLQSQQQFSRLQQWFAFESIHFCFQSKKVSKALFNAIKLLDQHPKNAYLVATIGRCFNELYEKQKSHHLNNIVDNPSPFREKNYNTLLEFISRLSLTDISNIGYHFMNQYHTALSADAEFSKVYQQAQKNYTETKSK